jgi:hypothetical protein
MSEMPPQDLSPSSPSPPRAFTQGVGTVFQFAGVTLFFVLMFVCCASGLLSPRTAIRKDLSNIGWPHDVTPDSTAAYSVPKAMTVALAFGVFCGIALAGLGLGLQATHRKTPLAAILLTGFACVLYLVHCIFFASTIHSWLLSLVCLTAVILFAVLLALSVAAAKEMRSNPPPSDQEVLPADYKVPYSHLHQDPPEVRLAHELQQRKERLAVQQKELEALEERIKRHSKEPPK